MFQRTINLKFSCEIAAPVKELYAFHTDTNNFTVITPSWIGVKIVSLKLPFFPLGLLVRPLIRYDMMKMFAYRHQRTKAIKE